MTEVSVWRSVLKLCDLLSVIFYRSIKYDGCGDLAVAVILVASVTDAHGWKQMPGAPVNVIEIAQKYAYILHRRLNRAAVEHRIIVLLVAFAVGKGEFLRTLLCLFVAQEKLFAVFGELLGSNLLTLREDCFNASL